MSKNLKKWSKAFIAGAFLTSVSFQNGYSQSLIKATGGEGMYRESIWWLDFSGTELSSSDEIIQEYNINDMYTLVIKVYDITFSGHIAGSRALSEQRIIGYNSGNFGGDGLVKLYNIGVPNGGASVSDRAQNTLYNALGFKYDGVTSSTRNGAKANFKVEAYAYINSTLDPIDVGLVFADAETDDHSYESMGEYSQGTTNGTSWQMLEKKLYDINGNQAIIISNDGKTARTICGFNGSTWSAGNVVLMYTKKANTSITSPLEVDIEYKGAGKSAIAIGFLLTGTDMGDAPSTYGTPQNIFFSTVLDGLPAADGTYYISTTGTKGGSPALNVGYLDYLTTPRFGDMAGDPDAYSLATLGENAQYDDINGIDDEDGIKVLNLINTRNSEYTINFNAYPTVGQNAYINAWIDFNQNGSFESSEFQALTITEDGDYSLTWSGIEPKVGGSFIRMRIQSNVPGLPTGAYDIKMGGETEDHALNITTFISGNVYHDADGLKGEIPNLISGSPINNINGEQLYVSLVSEDGDLLDQVEVNLDGKYEFSNINAQNYKLVLTTNALSTNPTISSDWTFVGEGVTASSTPDTNPNGIIELNVARGSGEIVNANFGIQVRPKSDNHFTTIPQPNSNDTLTLDGSILPYLSGTDLEDGIYSGFDGTFASPYGIVITALPTYGTLIYNGNIVEAGDTLFNQPDQKIKIVLTDTGYLSTQFQYTYLDRAGIGNLSPATYAIEWNLPLNMDLLEFNASIERNHTVLAWSVSDVHNEIKEFLIEKSTNGKDWISIGKKAISEFVSSDNGTYNFGFIDEKLLSRNNFYRLKMTSNLNTISYSKVVMVNGGENCVYTVYPNPSSSIINISGIKGGESIKFFNTLGIEIYELSNLQQDAKVDISQWAKGIYFMVIYDNQNKSNTTIKIDIK